MKLLAESKPLPVKILCEPQLVHEKITPVTSSSIADVLLMEFLS